MIQFKAFFFLFQILNQQKYLYYFYKFLPINQILPHKLVFTKSNLKFTSHYLIAFNIPNYHPLDLTIDLFMLKSLISYKC